MARAQNFLLGQGERIAEKVRVPKAGGDKNPPYDFGKARRRISERLSRVESSLASLPDDACPRGEAVAVMTMHPRFLSKSDFPDQLLSTVGLRTVGSRSRTIEPEQWGIEQHGNTAVTQDLFVAGTRSAFDRWAKSMKTWEPGAKEAVELTHVEDLSSFEAASKVRGIPKEKKVLLEVVLHNSGSDNVVISFIKYAQARGAEPLIDRRRDVQGLTFIPVRVDHRHVEDIAKFSFVRVARGMPTLRPFRPSVIRGASGFAVKLPTGRPLDTTLRAAIFDGGLPKASRSALASWVSLLEPAGLGPAQPLFEEHGLGVTTSFLFGPLQPGQPPSIPFCPVDHVRVLDDKTGSAADANYFDVLDRIVGHLDRNTGLYSLVNISLGPALAIDDDDVTLWTAALDKRFAHGNGVATVAAGNDGERDAKSGLNRVQPPADGVNVLSVGAANSTGQDWNRAAYSCTGPGRCPGVVKPDGLAFGGSEGEPFGVLTAQLRGGHTDGTSFAAPFALRSAAGVLVQLGDRLDPLGVRALLIHRAQADKAHSRQEVGWGRFEPDPLQLITCEDDETLVLFRGELPVGEHLRAPVPIRDVSLDGIVTLSATLVIAPEVDPEHPGAYTRSGLDVAFRPHKDKFAKEREGKKPSHPKTKPFFSGVLLYGKSERVLREDGHKWEPCLRHDQRFQAKSLKEPCFDIYYNHRDGGMKATDPQPIPYAFVVGLKAPQVPDLYDRVVRAYANVLVPIKPRTRIPIRT